MNGNKANDQTYLRVEKLFLANRSTSCNKSHQELPKMKLFMYQQTVQLKQAGVRLWMTECGTRRRVIDCETCLNG